ncbi:acyl-CoA thioesterase [Euzebya sp.]|uniref:acyl-CoA thioesterase n=1 Tax=Euzebya sp. TaxID=1971409 RepID=UPI003515B572
MDTTRTPAGEAPFTYPVEVRYMEVDQQGVVFNGWYLTWFDQAMMHFLAHRGLAYESMMARGYDVQLIHNQTTWRQAVRWLEPVEVAVAASRFGTTSFDLDFSVRVGSEERVTGRTTYVVVATDGSGKRPIPAFLREALAPLTPLIGG